MGVFQGSALGPLNYLLFSPTTYHCTQVTLLFFQYADDIQVLVSGQTDDLISLISSMEASLASLCDWLDWLCAHFLKLNVNETQLVVFGSRTNLRKVPGFSVTLHDSVLQPREEVMNLGATFDSALTWEAHFSELNRRCKPENGASATVLQRY